MPQMASRWPFGFKMVAPRTFQKLQKHHPALDVFHFSDAEAFGAILEPLGAILEHLGAILGPSWDHLGAILGSFGAILGRPGAILGHPATILDFPWFGGFYMVSSGAKMASWPQDCVKMAPSGWPQEGTILKQDYIENQKKRNRKT